jgi:NAD(P)-dependent dehydrogenase (short-subunit alcohol dehydrogenase family)
MQTVLITGAASGIGRQAARRFAGAGWRCMLVDCNADALSDLSAALPVAAHGAHLTRAADLTDAAQILALAQGAPPLDALINNAGMSDARNIPLAEQNAAQLAQLLALNLAAPAALVEAFAPLLRSGARIVNVASAAGLRAIPWRGAYSPSKAGLIAQSHALAQAWPDWCVSVLCPGFVRTELVDALIAEGRLTLAGAAGKTPLGRMASPAEMAEALYFLASTGAAPLSGQVLSVDGGSSVYGGSRSFEPALLEQLPLDMPLDLTIDGERAERWTETGGTHKGSAYRATLDASSLNARAAEVMSAVHEAARRFAARHDQQASAVHDWPDDARPQSIKQETL